MTLLGLILPRDPRDRSTAVLIAVLLGFTYVTFGTIVGLAVGEMPGEPEIRLLLGFLAIISLNLLLNALIVFRIFSKVENNVADLREDILDRVRSLGFPAYERIGHDRIYFNLTTNVRRVSEAAALLGRLGINMVNAVACLVMLTYLSPAAAAILLMALLTVGSVYAINQFAIGRAQKEANRYDLRFFSGLEHLLSGFKELKLHRRKTEEFFSAEVEEASREAEAARATSGFRFFTNYLLLTILQLVCAGATLFLLPLLVPLSADLAVRATILAGIFPASSLRDLPVVARAQAAVRELSLLRAALDDGAVQPSEPVSQEASGSDVQTFACEGAVYRYFGADGGTVFSVGPVSLSLEAGTVTFLVGGNGSGKTTLVRMLTGLYPLYSGRFVVNGQSVTTQALQDLVTPVFANPHLFDRLYGYRRTDREEVRRWLTDLEIDHKTDYSDGTFSDLDLSTGQRKRLALVAAMLEERPLVILDEWAAEQDPEHRQWFYEVFLPRLKTLGRAVLVVSHDDRFFSAADKIVRLHDGRVAS